MIDYSLIRFKFDKKTPIKAASTLPNLDNFLREDFLQVSKDVIPKIYNLIESLKKELSSSNWFHSWGIQHTP